jgi:hypothetical protein
MTPTERDLRDRVGARSALTPLVFCGRRFSAADLALIRQIVADCGPLGLTEIARTVCALTRLDP